MNKKLKVLFITLIIILLAMISFFGIYQKENFKVKNKLPDYELTKSLGKTIVSNLKVDDTVNEVTYDENGNVVENPSEEENANYRVEQEAVNKEEVLTLDNYKLSKEIIEKRLKAIGLPQYFVRLNEQTGSIQIEFEDDVNVQAGTYYASYQGIAEFLDENEEVKLDNSDIEKAEVGYNQKSAGSYQVYLTVTLNKQGQEKLQNIKNEINTQNNNENQTNTTNDTNTENVVETQAENETENTENAVVTETANKTLDFHFEDEEVGTVEITDQTAKKELRVNIGSAASDSTTINSNLNQGAVYAILINSGKMPIKYEIENSQDLVTEISKNQVNITIYALIAIIAVASIYQIIRYKKDGIVTVLSNIGAISIFLILLRYTNVKIGYEAFFIMLLLEIILIYFNNKVLNKIKNTKSVEELKPVFKNIYKEMLDVTIICVLVAVVFTFIKWTAINTMGMVMFWGIISIVFSYFVFTRTLLLNNRK